MHAPALALSHAPPGHVAGPTAHRTARRPRPGSRTRSVVSGDTSTPRSGGFEMPSLMHRHSPAPRSEPPVVPCPRPATTAARERHEGGTCGCTRNHRTHRRDRRQDHHLRDRQAGPPGRRRRRRQPRRHQGPDHDHRRARQGLPAVLPPDHRGRGADVRGGAHPRLVLQARGPSRRVRHPDLPPDRPPAAPDLRRGPAQRGPGRQHDPADRPVRPLRRRRHERLVAGHHAVRAAVPRPGRVGALRAEPQR